MTRSGTEDLLAARRQTLELLLQQRRSGPEIHALQDEVLDLERAVAAERAEPHAVPWSPGEIWNGMAYSPVVFGDAFGCAIVFATRARTQAVVSFRTAAGYRLTDISDETIEGHPLTGRGLIAYRAFIVKNSPWVAELEAIDKVHPQHDAERWRTSQHYLLCFKDRMFEAICRDVQVLGVFGAFDDALRRAADELRPVGTGAVG
jgi:hypothetical protein